MDAYICTVCGYLYDKESAKKTVEEKLLSFTELDDEWTCPICNVSKDLFKLTDSDRIQDQISSKNSN